MLILDNKFTRRFRIHVHVISLITISVNAAPQNKDVIMELKQLSVNRGNPISDSMKEHGPKMMSQMKTTFNPNIFLTGSSSMRPNAARANNSKANMTNAQLLLRDTYNAPIAFPKNSLPAIRASDNINFKSASSRNDRTRQAYCSSIIGGTFCNTSGDDYPKKLVENILRDSTFRPLFNKYFGNDTITSDVENLSTRIEFDNSEPTEYDNFKPICASEEQLVIPYKALNNDKEWKYILQGDNAEKLQTIRVELCSSPLNSCQLIEMSNGYQSRCVQKYMYRKLLAISTEKKQPAVDDFLVPSCCSCKYSEELQFRGNFSHKEKSGKGR